MKQSVAPEAPKADAASQSVSVSPEAAPAAESTDTSENKLLAVVGYLIPILFFVPMLAEKRSPFAMFHANQHVSLLIFAIVVQIVGTFIPIIGWFIVLPIGTLASIVIAIIGAVRAANGETRPLPLIGGFSIIK